MNEGVKVLVLITAASAVACGVSESVSALRQQPPPPPFAGESYTWGEGDCLKVDAVQPSSDGVVWVWSHPCAQDSIKPSPVTLTEWRQHTRPLE